MKKVHMGKNKSLVSFAKAKVKLILVHSYGVKSARYCIRERLTLKLLMTFISFMGGV